VDNKGKFIPLISVHFLNPGFGLGGTLKPCLPRLAKVWSAEGRKRSGSSYRTSKFWIPSKRLGSMSLSSSGFQVGSQVTCMSSLSMDSVFFCFCFCNDQGKHSPGRLSCHSCQLTLSLCLSVLWPVFLRQVNPNCNFNSSVTHFSVTRSRYIWEKGMPSGEGGGNAYAFSHP